jgi:hypothetical protein
MGRGANLKGCACLLLCLARLASAEPRVVIADTRDAPSLPTLGSQVEVRVNRRATVQTLAARDADPLTYAARASELVASGEATIVVWIAPVDGGFLVFAAGSWPGRALIELVRIDATVGSAEIERTVALKIAGLLDSLLVPRVDARVALAIAPRSRAPADWRIAIEGLVAHEAHERGFDGRVGIAVSRAWTIGRWIVAPTIAGYWQPSGAIESNRGRASITEPGAVIAVEGGTDFGTFQVFARPRFVAALLVARGASQDGRQGEAVVFAPYGGLEAGVRHAISESASVGLVTGCDVALIHNELLIDQVTVVDLGRFRLHVGFALTVSL